VLKNANPQACDGSLQSIGFCLVSNKDVNVESFWGDVLQFCSATAILWWVCILSEPQSTKETKTQRGRE